MHRYKIRYTLRGEPMREMVEGTGPVSALDKFHKSMQLTSEIDPKDYKILSLGLVYNLDPTGGNKLDNVESRYDVPNTPNPDLRPVKKEKLQEEPILEFMATLSSGRLAP